MAQLPSGAAGAATGVLIWSFMCLTFNAVLLWLLWTINERRSYIFLISSLAFLASITSITEQIYDIIYWNDVMTARLEWIKADPENPMIAASDGCTGLGLVTWSIRWGCYVAEAGIACFWAFSLTQAVYCWRDDIRVHRTLNFINQAGKPFTIFVAALTMSLLQIEGLQESYTWWNFVLNFAYCTFCVGGLFMLFLILLEYIQTRRLFRRMNSQQRKEFLHEHSFTPQQHNRSLSNATSVMTAARPRLTADDSDHFGALQQHQGGIYDKYLVARTSIPFIALCLFEIDNILINSSRPATMRALARAPAPDLTAATAASYLVGFIPGCLASLVVPVAFGTTRQLRDKLYHTFVPARLQAPSRRRRWSREQSYFAGMDSDAGILSRNRRLSMEKRLRIEVTYEFEVRNEVVVVSSEGGTGAGAGGGGGGGGDGGGTRSEKRPATVGTQQVEKKNGKRAPSPQPPSLERPLPPTPPPENSQDLYTYPYSVDSHRWDDTARMLPKKPSISFLRGQM